MAFNQSNIILIITKRLSLVIAITLLFSCQPGMPVITVLGQVGGFSLNENIQILSSKYNKSNFSISGNCSNTIKNIEISFDNGSNFTSLSSYAEIASIDCAGTGTFSMTFNPNNQPIFDIPSSATYIDFKIRGLSDFGYTSAQNFRRMVNVGNNFQLTAGSTNTTSGGISLKGRIVSSVNTTTSGAFKFKGSIRIK